MVLNGTEEGLRVLRVSLGFRLNQLKPRHYCIDRETASIKIRQGRSLILYRKDPTF